MSFLSRPVDLLTGDGRLIRLAGGAAWRRPRLLLSRSLCSFAHFETAGMTALQARRAARLRGAVAAPYPASGLAMRRDRRGYDLWWWDAAQVATLLAGRFGEAPAPIPETLAQPPGEHWRIVALHEGFEAQHWHDGALMASQWRRARFDEAAWTAFVRGGAAGDDATPARPALVALSSLAFASGQSVWDEADPAAMARAAAVLAVAVLIATIGVNLGQGWRRATMAREAGQQAAALKNLPLSAAALANRDGLKRIRSFQALQARQGGLSRLALAMDVMDEAGVSPTAIDMDGDTLSFDIPYADLDQLASLSAQLESVAGFKDVHPTTDATQKLIHLTMRIGGAGPAGPVTAAG